MSEVLGFEDTSLEAAGGGDASDAATSNVTTRDTIYYRDRVSSDSVRYFQSIVEAVGIIICNDSENS